MKYRVIVNSVSFNTNTAQIKRGVGDLTSINHAVQCAMNALTNMRDTYSLKPLGLCGHWDGHDVQIDIQK
jgi:hypothetical protein